MTGLEPTAEFVDAARALAIDFEPGDLERLGSFLGLLLEANKTTNLTAITDPAQAWMRHILDALTIVPVLASVGEADQSTGDLGPGNGAGATRPVDEKRGGRAAAVIDVGSGGGVPALPLAIILPEMKFTLVEATGKKAEFLKKASAALKLTNVTVLQDRAEKLGQDHKVHRERYDAAMARALGHLAIVAELCGPLVRPGGVVVAVKGAKAEQELQESGKALGLIGLRHTETVQTPTGRLVVLEKTVRTPRGYPRRDGEPARLPLGLGSSADRAKQTRA